MQSFYQNKKILYLKEATDLLSDLSINDFIEIWSRIQSLPPSKINSKEEWQSIISEYYRENCDASPIFAINEGVDFTSVKYYLQLIKEEVEKNK